MSAVVVAKFEKKPDARVISTKNCEEVYLAEMIDKGMKEKGEIQEEQFRTWLKRKIKSVR